MSDVLTRIKRAALAGRCVFTRKARIEMREDGLSEMEVIESLVYASGIYKTLRSTSPFRNQRKERLYVILGRTLGGLRIYTKGKLVTEAATETLYVLVSSKKAR